jgi:precorrin-6B methylase 2
MNTTLQPIIDDVLSLQTYTPSDEVNNVMGSLVHGVIDTTSTYTAQVVTSLQILKVQKISAETESELEKFWARLVIKSSNPLETLRSFPYLDNYEELTRREIGLIEHSGLRLDSKHKALVIGSGPLPLSAYELHRQTGVQIDHVDSSSEAILLCEQLMDSLGVDSKYYEALGEAVELQDAYNLVLIAALAGSTVNDKQKIINTVLPHLAEGGRIVIRSAKGSRTLLYPGIESSEIQGVRLFEEYHPSDYIINSVFVYGR